MYRRNDLLFLEHGTLLALLSIARQFGHFSISDAPMDVNVKMLL